MKIFLDSDFADDSADETRSNSESAKRKGGRPAQIDEGQLFNHRDRFIGILSFAWGDIGWRLKVAGTIQDVRAAFSCLKLHAHEFLLNPFARSTAVQASALEIRRTKQIRGQTVEKMYELQSLLNTATQKMRDSGSAVSQNIHSPHMKPLLREHVQRLRDFRRFSRAMDRVNIELKVLDTLIADQEAYYAQHQLLEFIAYAKYAHTPRNLAQAMAGLPLIGCWHSFQLCEKEPSPLWTMKPDELPPLFYRIFLIIQECWNKRNRDDARRLLQSSRERIRALPPTSDLRAELKREWRYMRQAIEETDLAHTPSEEVPHLIFSAYLRNKGQPRSSEESALAEIEERQI